MNFTRLYRLDSLYDKESKREFFYYSLCHVCKEFKTSLMRCTDCNVVSYCSTVHQIQDWPNHKSLCETITASAKKVLLLPPHPSRVELNTFQMQLAMNWKMNLGRELEMYEHEMWMYPKVCAVCYTNSVIILCEKCPSVSYCSKEHQEQDRENHDKFCKSLHLCLDAHKYAARQNRPNVWQNVTLNFVKVPINILPGTLEDVVRTISAMNGLDFSDNPMELVFGTEHFCHIATILHALDKCYITVERNALNDRLIFHVICSELDNYADWFQFMEFFSHWIHNLTYLQIVIIHPGVAENKEVPFNLFESCKHCRRKNFYGTVIYMQCSYGEFINHVQDEDLHPDLILLFNGQFPPLATLECFQAISKFAKMNTAAPIVITGNTKEDVDKELGKFPQIGFIVYHNTQENPYRSTRPMRNCVLGQAPVVYRHHFIAIVAKEV